MTQSSVVHHSQFPTILKGDSGATNHYVTPAVLPQLTKIHKNSSVSVTLPDNNVIESTQSGHLNLPTLSTKATMAHVLPQLSTLLLSLGQLADDGCLILLNNKFLKVFKNFELILHGYRNQSDGLWDIPLPQNNRSQEKTTDSNGCLDFL